MENKFNLNKWKNLIHNLTEEELNALDKALPAIFSIEKTLREESARLDAIRDFACVQEYLRVRTLLINLFASVTFESMDRRREVKNK